MATVRMSKTLIDQILNNFKNQCATAYANNSGAGDFVQEVNRSLHSPDFYALIDKHQEYQEMVEAFRTKNNEQNTFAELHKFNSAVLNARSFKMANKN